MFNTDLDALVPMLCVTLTALATMGTEAFRGRNERLPIGWSGLDRAGRRGAVGRAAVEPQRRRLRRHRRRQLRPVRHLRAGRRRRADDHVLVAGRRPRRDSGRRVLRAGAVLDRRHDHDGDGDRSAGHLHRARDPVARRLRADRHPARQRQRHRGGVQVLPARRVLERVLPLRHRVHLRRHRQHAARGASARSCRRRR